VYKGGGEFKLIGIFDQQNMVPNLVLRNISRVTKYFAPGKQEFRQETPRCILVLSHVGVTLRQGLVLKELLHAAKRCRRFSRTAAFGPAFLCAIQALAL
jgi:hypothetical protein